MSSIPPVNPPPVLGPPDAAQAADLVAAHYERTRLAAFFFALLPGGLIAFFGLTAGGYFPGATALAAFFLAIVLALRLIFLPVSLTTFSRLLTLAVVAFGAFVVWTWLSKDWSGSEIRATLATDKALVYFLALLLFGSFPSEARRIRWMLLGVTGAIVAICVLAVGSRLLPDLFVGALNGTDDSRLSYPLSYWNALGLFAATGLIFCLHLSKSRRDGRPARVLSSAATPLLVCALYLTLSRGGILSAVAGIFIYLLVSRPQGTIAMLLSVVPPSVVAVVATVNAPGLVTTAFKSAPGGQVAVVLALCMLAAAVLRFVLIPLDSRLDITTPLARAGRPVKAAVGVTAAILVVGLVVGLGGARIAGAWDQFFHGPAAPATVEQATGNSRLGSATSSGRVQLWNAALAQYEAAPVTGGGAGTFTLAALRQGLPSYQLNAHSIYLETLGELGLVGLALLVATLLSILVGFVKGIRGEGRSTYAVLLAAYVAWLLHNAVDWDWQIPATTLWVFALGGATLAAPAVRGQRSTSFARFYRSRISVDRSAIPRLAAAVACVLLAVFPLRIVLSQTAFDRATAAFEAGDCGLARTTATDSLSLTPWRPDAHVIIARCLLQSGDPDGGIEQMRQALALDPRSGIQLYRLAQAQAAAGRDPTNAMGRAVDLNPANYTFEQAQASYKAATTPDARRQVAESLPQISVVTGRPFDRDLYPQPNSPVTKPATPPPATTPPSPSG